MNQLFRPLPCLFVAAVLAATSSHALANARHKHAQHERKTETGATGNENAALNKEEKGKRAARVASKRHKKAPSDEKPATPPLTGDLAAVKNAIDLARQGKTSDATAVEKSMTDDHPLTAKGRLALARVLLNEGDRDAAQRLVRETWRSEDLSERSESDLLDTFRDLLTQEDYQARMDKRVGAKDISAAMRAAISAP